MKKTVGIRAFLGLGHALLLLVSLGAIGFVWSQNEYQVTTQALKNAMRERVSLIAKIIGHELAEYDALKFDDAEFSVIAQDKNQFVVFIDNSGVLQELVPGSVSPRQDELFLRLNQDHPAYREAYVSLIDSDAQAASVYAAAPVLDARGERLGTVCLLMPLGDLEAYITRARLFLLSAMIIVGLLGIGVSVALTNSLSRHFLRAQEMAATVASGDYHLRIPEAGPTELRDLSHYLNQMAEKLQEQLKMRQTLLSNVTHELIRPLAGLQLGIESLRKGAVNDPELADDLLVSMGQTIKRLEALIDDIALAARPESRPVELICTPVAVEPFLQGLATRFWGLTESRGLRLKVHVEAGLPPISADEKRLNQILGNLVDNAIKFTPRGNTIELSAQLEGDSFIRLMVHDGGEGISAEEAEYIFEPFYQGDKGRRIKQGIGLGLSIARQLTLAHGGELWLENDPQGGTRAIFTLPMADS